jgi:hypothetical protein
MAHIKDRGKDLERRWQARYRDPDGHEKSRTFTRKMDAQRWLNQVTADLVTGRYVNPRAGRVTLADFAHSGSNRRPSTLPPGRRWSHVSELTSSQRSGTRSYATWRNAGDAEG